MIKVDWRVLKSHDLVISFNDRLSKKNERNLTFVYGAICDELSPRKCDKLIL